MKILQIITQAELGGAQSVVANLSNVLCLEHEVTVVAGKGNGKFWEGLSPNVKKKAISSLKRNLSPFCDLLTLFYFIYLRIKLKPDIIHLHSSKAGTLGRLAFPRSKVIYTVHGFDSIRIAYRKFLPIEKIMQKYCKAIVGVSLYDQNNLLKEGVNHNVICIYNGILPLKLLNTDPFIFIKSYKYKILCVARLSPPKDVDLFLKIAYLLPEYAFIWIGNQHEFIGDKTKNVFFMGNLFNAGAYNEYVDLFMLPSNYEGLPMVIIEAMSLAKPIISSNVGGISEIVRNGINGFTVNNTPECFVNKIRYVLEDRHVYSNYSKASFELFRDKLTVNTMVEKYLEIYNK